MAYSSTTHVDRIIAQALTSAAPHSTGKVNLWTIGNTRNVNEISDETVNQYIRWADDEIDSNLSEMYRVPLHRVSNGEWYLEQDIDEYNPTNIVVSDATNLIAGDEIYIISTAFNPPIKEDHIVKAIIDIDEFTVEEPILTNFPAGEETRIVRVGFPPAITLVSARKSAAAIWDKYFSAMASPDISDYGNNLRILSLSQMTDILNGVIILHGQERIGNRFANSTLYDRYQILDRGDNASREVKTQ